MGSVHRRSIAARGGLLAVFAVMGGLAGAPALAQPRPLPPSREPCYQYNPVDRVLDAKTCSDLANIGSQPRQYTVYANFNAGRAYRVGGNFAAAELALNDVVNFRPPPLGSKPLPADLRFELTRVEAEMELARLYQAQPGRKADAAAHAANAIGGYSSYYNNAAYASFKDEALRGRIDATLLLADVQTNMPPANKVAAFEALALRGLFLDPALDSGPADLVRTGRERLQSYATDLGQLQLDANDLTAAAAYYDVALKAALLLRARDNTLNVAPAYINLGRVSMRRAGGFAGPYSAGGCTTRGGDFDQLSEAARLFDAAGTSVEALLWKGCAMVAANNFNGALDAFGAASAAATAERASNPYPDIALARAYVARAGSNQATSQDWSNGHDAYLRAIAILDRQGADPAQRAGIHGELAGLNMTVVRLLGPSSTRTGLVTEARRHLEAAAALLDKTPQLTGEQAQIFLNLAEVQIGEDPFGGATTSRADADKARNNIDRALERAGGTGQTRVRAEGNFLLSKLDARLGNWPNAIRSADEAVGIGGDRLSDYRAQACDMRLLSRPRRLTGGEQYCKALHNGSDLFDASLREGVYYLSVGSMATGATAQRAWSDAYRAFDAAANALPAFPVTGPYSAEDQLKARLLAGKGQAMICTGLRPVGTDLINNDIPGDLRNDARDYFSPYGIRC